MLGGTATVVTDWWTSGDVETAVTDFGTGVKRGYYSGLSVRYEENRPLRRGNTIEE